MTEDTSAKSHMEQIIEVDASGPCTHLETIYQFPHHLKTLFRTENVLFDFSHFGGIDQRFRGLTFSAIVPAGEWFTYGIVRDGKLKLQIVRVG